MPNDHGRPDGSNPGGPDLTVPIERLAALFVVTVLGLSLLAGIGGGVGTASAANQTNTTDWPMFGGDIANTGHINTTGPVNDITQQWRFPIPSSSNVVGSPAVVNGTVYVAVGGPADLLAVDANTGTEQWRFDEGGAMRSSPAVADGTVYVNSLDPNVYAVNASTGQEQWNFTTGGDGRSAPVVANGTVYVGGGSGDNDVYALNATTGAKKWNFTTGNNVLTSPAVANGIVYVGSDDADMYALDAETGAKVWSFSTGSQIRSSPTVANGTVYFGSFDFNVYAVDAEAGVERWNVTTGSLASDSSPAVANGTVYVGDGDNNVYALDADTGTKQWNFTTGDFIESSPAVVNGTVYVGSRDDNLYALDADTGEREWNFTAGARVHSSPAVVNGTVYIGRGDGNLAALTEPKPATFQVSLGATNAPVTEGETVTVNATVENTGDERGTRTVTLSIDGTEVDSTSLILEPDGSQTVTLSWTPSEGDAGDHTVTVASATDSASTSVTVESANRPPTADFTVTPRPPTAGERVTFDASNSSDPDGSIAVYEWSTGNGTIGTGETTTYTFGEAGPVSVTLTVTDDAGATDTASKLLSVEEATNADTGGGGGGAGNGGGGGGGVGGGDDNVQSAISKPLDDESPEEAGTQVRFGSSSVEEVAFESEEVAGSGQITVEQRGSPPQGVADEFGDENVVTSVDIEVPEAARDSPATIRFRLSESEFSNCDPDSLQVVRVVDGENQRLTSDASEGSNGDCVVETNTPGFSTFAVVAVQGQTEPTTEATTATEAETPTSDAEPSTTAEPESAETDAPTTAETPGGQDGFGVAVALVAIVVATLYAHRRGL